MTTITITVAGAVGTGKSAVALAILDALRACDIGATWDEEVNERSLGTGAADIAALDVKPSVRLVEVAQAGVPPLPPVRRIGHEEPGYIVVKEHVWTPAPGERPELGYLWPAAFGCMVFPNAEAAHAFIQQPPRLPLGWVVLRLGNGAFAKPEPPAPDPTTDKLRTAVADLIATEGCGCCADFDKHQGAIGVVAQLLGVSATDDPSDPGWFDWAEAFAPYRTKPEGE